MTSLTDQQVAALLSHPNGMVRSLADWTREYRGNGFRGLTNAAAALNTERKLIVQLERLECEACGTGPGPALYFLAPKTRCGCAYIAR